MKNRLFAVWAGYSAFLPLYALAGLILLPAQEVWLYFGLLLAMAFLGLLFGRLFRKNVFYANIIGALLALLVIGTIMYCGRHSSVLDNLCNVLAGAMSIVTYLLGQRAGVKQWYEAVQPGLFLTMLFLYAVMHLFVRTIWPFGDYTRLFLGAVLYTAVFALFAMNKLSLGLQLNRNRRYKNKQVAAEDSAVSNRTAALPISGSLRRHNLMMVTVTLLAALMLAPVVSAGLSAAGEAIVERLNDREEAPYEEISHVAPEPEEIEVADESRPDRPEVRKALNIISLAAFGLLAVIVLFVVVKKAREWVKKLFEGQSRSMRRRKDAREENGDEMYDEIVEGIELELFGGKKLRDVVKERIGWMAMRTEEEKVRYLFRHAVRRAKSKGYRHKLSNTAFETLGEIAYADGALPHEKAYRELADAYNTTRYDHAPPPEGTAAAIRERLK